MEEKKSTQAPDEQNTKDFNQSSARYSFEQEKMPFCLSLLTGLFFLATPTFIGLRRADFAALDLNNHLTNNQLFIAELSVCIAFTILIGMALYQCPKKRYSESMENYIKFSNDDNTMNKRTVGMAFLYFTGIGILFSAVNIYFLPHFSNALSKNIWSLKIISLLILIDSGLLLFPILLQNAIKGTRNKVVVVLLAYLFLASGIALHVLPNISLIKSKKIITIMHQINFYAAATCSLTLLLLIIAFVVLNYNSINKLNQVDCSDGISFLEQDSNNTFSFEKNDTDSDDNAPDMEHNTKGCIYNLFDQKTIHREKKNRNIATNLPYPSDSPLIRTPNIPPPIPNFDCDNDSSHSKVTKFNRTSDNSNDVYVLNEKNEPKLKLKMNEQKAGYYDQKPLSYFDDNANNPDLATPSSSIKTIVYNV